MPMNSSYMQSSQHMQAPYAQDYSQQGPSPTAGHSHQPYQDPSAQQQSGLPSYQQSYQQQNSGMQTLPSGSMGMHSNPSNPWQQSPAAQQQPWGMQNQTPQGFGQSQYPQQHHPYPQQQHQYPQAGMGMFNSQMPSSDMMTGQQQQYMHAQQHMMSSMLPQQHGMQQQGMQHGMQQQGGQWYPPPGVPSQTLGMPGMPFQSAPMQSPAGDTYCTARLGKLFKVVSWHDAICSKSCHQHWVTVQP